MNFFRFQNQEAALYLRICPNFRGTFISCSRHFFGLFLLMFLTALPNLFAQSISPSDFHWVIATGRGKVTAKKEILELNMIAPGEQKDCWHLGQLKKEYRLDGKQYLSFAARSTDGKSHLIIFYIHRELQPGNAASFYTRIEVTPEWKDYSIRLKTGSYQQASQGYFIYSGGKKNSDMELSKGGRLVHIQPATRGSATIQIKDITLGSEKKK